MWQKGPMNILREKVMVSNLCLNDRGFFPSTQWSRVHHCRARNFWACSYRLLELPTSPPRAAIKDSKSPQLLPASSASHLQICQGTAGPGSGDAVPRPQAPRGPARAGPLPGAARPLRLLPPASLEPAVGPGAGGGRGGLSCRPRPGSLGSSSHPRVPLILQHPRDPAAFQGSCSSRSIPGFPPQPGRFSPPRGFSQRPVGGQGSVRAEIPVELFGSAATGAREDVERVRSCRISVTQPRQKLNFEHLYLFRYSCAMSERSY